MYMLAIRESSQHCASTRARYTRQMFGQTRADSASGVQTSLAEPQCQGGQESQESFAFRPRPSRLHSRSPSARCSLMSLWPSLAPLAVPLPCAHLRSASGCGRAGTRPGDEVVPAYVSPAWPRTTASLPPSCSALRFLRTARSPKSRYAQPIAAMLRRSVCPLRSLPHRVYCFHHHHTTSITRCGCCFDSASFFSPSPCLSAPARPSRMAPAFRPSMGSPN